jgi:signal transduction histidine kinase
MPKGGRLAIGTADIHLSAANIPVDGAAPGRYVAISVADTRTGMPPKALERVFEPIFTTKPVGQGTGLSQVYGFVRQSNGLVQIESALGQGTTVRLLLPLHDLMEAAQALNASPPLQAVSQATVLLVVTRRRASPGGRPAA